MKHRRSQSGDARRARTASTRKRGILICEECVGHGAPVKGDEATGTERSAGAWQELTSTRLTSGDATDTLSLSSRDELEDRIMGMTAQVVDAVFHSSAHKQIAHGSTRARLASDTSARIATPRRLTQHQLRERLDLSKLDALPQLQTIQWIPRGLDRKYQGAKANTAAPIHRLWSKLALITPHLILRAALGHKQQEEGWAASEMKLESGLLWRRNATWNNF